MDRYIAVLLLAIGLAIWLPIILSPWLVMGPWRLVKKIGRIGRHTRVKRGVISG